MSLTEQIYEQALALTENPEEVNQTLLKVLCRGAQAAWQHRLRDGVTPEDCKADFVAAASLTALAALSEADELAQLEQFRVGDLTLQRSHTDGIACCLRDQAEAMMAPYLKDGFSFVGV